ncbi:MAG: hypothetical protein ACRYGG_22860 [Janthinobacterium lividum]
MKRTKRRVFAKRTIPFAERGDTWRQKHCGVDAARWKRLGYENCVE